VSNEVCFLNKSVKRTLALWKTAPPSGPNPFQLKFILFKQIKLINDLWYSKIVSIIDGK